MLKVATRLLLDRAKADPVANVIKHLTIEVLEMHVRGLVSGNF
jgi:hypothetical protein